MRLVLMLFCLLTLLNASAQRAEKALEQFAKNYPQEKVVLTFSKPEYIAGETIYFKAHLLSGYELSLLSTNLYTELYDKDKNLLQKQLVYLQKGIGHGSFALPSSMAEDVYYIRAYTHWMLNFEEAFQCIKPLPIYNPYSSQSLRPKQAQWTAKAFIESNTLLDNTAANVVVRLYSQGTLPSVWSGKLVEKGTNTIFADLTIYNNEIGQVRFIPHGDESYQLLLKDNNGNAMEVDLPSVQTKGIVLQTAISAEKLRYGILFQGVASGGKGYKLIATINNEPVIVANITKSPGQISGTFDISKFPAGVLQLTLFDENEKPVAERLCFLHQNALSVAETSVSTHTLSFAPKGRNRWQLGSDTLNWESLSIEVADAGIPQPLDFLTSVYLTSDLLTPVHNQEWYFTAVTPEKMAALDALLVTEKWRRFQWNEILENRFPTLRYQPVPFLNFTGVVTKAKKPQPLREMNLVLQTKDSSVNFLQVTTDSAGRFSLENIIFTDTLKIYYQPNKRKLLENDLAISFTSNNRFYPFNGTLPPGKMTLGPRSKGDSLPLFIQKALAQRAAEQLLTEKIKILEEVVVSTTVKSPTEELDQQLTSGLFTGTNALVFDFVNQKQLSAIGYNNILEWMQARVPGLTFSNQNGTLYPMIRNEAAQIYLDEIATEPNMINGLPVADIAMIKVFRGNFAGGLRGGSAIAIYTRRGGLSPLYKAPTLPKNILTGYQKVLLPLLPDYTQPLAREIKDERTILFSSMVLRPQNSAEKTWIEFYNNDTAKSFRLLITGFTKEGQLVYVNRIIQ